MESSKFHQQHQDHQPALDSSCYGLSWSQNPIFANMEANSRDMKQHVDSNTAFVPCHNTSTPTNNVPINPNEHFMTRELQSLAKMEDEFSSSESTQKFSEMISSSPTSSIEDMHFNSSHGYNNNQELLLRTFSNGCQIRGNHVLDQFPDQDGSNNRYQYSSTRSSSARGTFSQILPTINISNLNQSPIAVSSDSFDMNLPALDLFGSPRFSSHFSHPSSFQIPYQVGSFFKDTCLSYGLDQMHQPNHRPVISHSKLASSFNTRTNCADTKRPATSYMDTKAPQAAVQKKSKLEPRPSCAPFKVRKEKLGDRIAALQQLVAPFGKTDTASVLMEAIGYINFLQNQVETLSLPYMKPTYKNNMLPTRGVSAASENEEGKQDLRSRGLCLVPLSCLSYVTDSSGNVWPAV